LKLYVGLFLLRFLGYQNSGFFFALAGLGLGYGYGYFLVIIVGFCGS
jgi:hypothetical protein